MGIGAELACIASHRLELALEGGGDIDPRISGEAARIRPFGAAGRVESVNGSDASFGRSRGDERGLEYEVVLAVDVAAVLAVDHGRAAVPHRLFQRLGSPPPRHAV